MTDQLDQDIIIKHNVKSYNSSLQIIQGLGYNPPILYLEHANQNEIIDNEKSFYFIFDGPGTDAFVHWIGEAFIFFPLLLQVKSIYPNVKILTKNKKKYVRSMFKFFKINIDIIHEINNYNNVCFFPPTISLNDMNIDMEIFEKYILNYMNEIEKLTNDCFNFNNKILHLPRNSVDNYVNNDRRITYQEDIEKEVLNRGGISLDTYKLNNMYLQFYITKHSDIVIVDAGSSFYVNCMCLKNKKIIILNGGMFSQLENHRTLKFIFDIINQNNEIIILNSNDQYINHI